MIFERVSYFFHKSGMSMSGPPMRLFVVVDVDVVTKFIDDGAQFLTAECLVREFGLVLLFNGISPFLGYSKEKLSL